jgi:hypothetical protein
MLAFAPPSSGGHAKPTVLVTDLQANPLVFAKVGSTHELQVRLRREHRALSKLSSLSAAELRFPPPLFLDTWQGRTVLGVAPIPTDVRHVGPRQSNAAHERLSALVRHLPAPGPLRESSRWLTELNDRIDQLTDLWRSRCRTALDAVLTHASASGHPVALGMRHGDWSPWNVARATTGEWWSWDLEFFHHAAPLGLDHVNWGFTVLHGLKRHPVEAALSGTRQLARARVDSADIIVDLFALELAVRHAGFDPGGTSRDGQLGDRLLQQLLT